MAVLTREHGERLSLRSSERGLKSVYIMSLDRCVKSLRSSERGLKCDGCEDYWPVDGRRSVRRSVD